MKLDCTTAESALAANERVRIRQRIEGQDLQQLKKGTSSAEKLTLSFHVKSTVTGTAIVNLYDADNNRHISKSYTVSSADTWEKKIITFEGDTTGALDNDNASSLELMFYIQAGSNFTSGTLATSWASHSDANDAVGQTINAASSTSNNFLLTGIQLEVGSVATPFESRSFGEELALCQRYYQILPKYTFMVAVEVGTTSVRGGLALPTNMRANPTIGSHNLTRYDDDDNTFSNKTPIVFLNSGSDTQSEPEAGGQSGQLSLAYNSIMSGGTDNHNVTTLFGTQASLDAEL
jgi:hypothetical protein